MNLLKLTCLTLVFGWAAGCFFTAKPMSRRVEAVLERIEAELREQVERMKASRRVLFTAHTQKWHEKELLSFLDKMRAMMCDARSIHRLGFSCKFVQTGHPGLGNIKSKCYCFQNDQRPKTYDEADAYCRGRNMTLASLESFLEEASLNETLASPTQFWTSGRASVDAGAGAGPRWFWQATGGRIPFYKNALAVDESVNGTIFGCDAASSDWCRLRHFARAGRADCDAGDAGDCRLAVASLAGVYSKRHRVGDELKTNLQKWKSSFVLVNFTSDVEKWLKNERYHTPVITESHWLPLPKRNRLAFLCEEDARREHWLGATLD